jgi:excisionase family DNA binding protein
LNEQESLLDVNGVAKLLGCSPWTVRKWETEGRLEATRLGKLVRFDMEAIRAFIAAGRKPAEDGKAK